jgi:hypothetical protein
LYLQSAVQSAIVPPGSPFMKALNGTASIAPTLGRRCTPLLPFRAFCRPINIAHPRYLPAASTSSPTRSTLVVVAISATKIALRNVSLPIQQRPPTNRRMRSTRIRIYKTVHPLRDYFQRMENPVVLIVDATNPLYR